MAERPAPVAAPRKPVVIRDARYLATATDHTGLPAPEFPEIAFAGRSNVGKSSRSEEHTSELQSL